MRQFSQTILNAAMEIDHLVLKLSLFSPCNFYCALPNLVSLGYDVF